ncbi:MAG TPA: hypothetical protein VKB75_07190 [Jatrophihabitans sp.]|nr:hypothetical protein [Jatrophihabitans sp.]
MSSEHDLSRADAERLLAGGSAGPAELTALLRAATAQPSWDELTGQERAVEVLRAARLHPAPTPGRRKMIKTILTQLAAAKVAIATAAVAVAATGGVTLAAATGTLPSTHAEATASLEAGAALGPTSSATATNTATPTDTAAPTDTATPTDTAVPTGTAVPTDTATPPSTPAPTEGPTATDTATSTETPTAPSTPSPTTSKTHRPHPDPVLVKLCYRFEDVSASGQLQLTSPTFSLLITAAGDSSNVASFCTRLLAQGD